MIGEYVRHWLPVLNKLNGVYIHQPYLLSEEEQEEYSFFLGKDYPNASVKLEG